MFAIVTQCLTHLLAAYASIISTINAADYFGTPIVSQAYNTATCYDWFEVFLEENYDRNKDYSEGLFDDDKMTLEQATERKYAYIFDKLGLQPGMKLLDAGCGTGKWMQYASDRGVEVVGLTLSDKQADVVRKKGLEVHVLDYRDRNEDFVNRFDRITALGSSEHICSSVGYADGKVAERCNETRIKTWKLLSEYLKPSGKMYVTLLTINQEKTDWTFDDYVQAATLERTYGGFYSTMSDIEHKVIPFTGFKMTDLQDKTADYHWSSFADPDHFGYWNIKWHEHFLYKVGYTLQGVFTDPQLIPRWVYYNRGTWISWQFGSVEKKYLTPEQVKVAPVHLKYFMLEKVNPAAN